MMKMKKQTKETRTRIDIRCSDREKALLSELAEDRGMTLSEYIREKLFGRKVTVRLLDEKTIRGDLYKQEWAKAQRKHQESLKK